MSFLKSSLVEDPDGENEAEDQSEHHVSPLGQLMSSSVE